MATAVLFAGSVITGAYAQETIKIGVTQPLTGAFAASPLSEVVNTPARRYQRAADPAVVSEGM